ncbi:MAG: hypothetical protein P8077_04790, partial [Gammaproteobacteria bacterium]
MTNIDLSWIKTRPLARFIAYDVDCYKLFSYLKTKYENCFLFESLAIPRHQDRYLSIGFDAPLIFSASGNQLRITGTSETIANTVTNTNTNTNTNTKGQSQTSIVFETENPYETLKHACHFNSDAPTHAGGLVGYFCHESVNYFEPSLALKEHPDFSNFKMG